MKKLLFAQLFFLLLLGCSNPNEKSGQVSDIQNQDTINPKDTLIIPKDTITQNKQEEPIGLKIFDKDIIAQNDVKTIGQFLEKVGVKESEMSNYEINGESILELYNKENGQFVGFVGDTSKFDYHKLKYFKQNKRLNYLVGKFGNPWADYIYQKKISIGMTKEMALESWGKPKDINTTITETLRSEQWVYDDGQYLYFENDFLTTIQN